MNTIEYWIKNNIEKKKMRQWTLLFTFFIFIASIPLLMYKICTSIKFLLKRLNQHYRGFIKEKQVWENKDKQ